MEAEDILIVDIGDAVSRDVTVAGNGMDLLGEEIGAYKDCIISMGLWQLSDEVNTNLFPRSSWHVEWLSYCMGMSVEFLPGTSVASVHIFLHKGLHGRPPEVGIDKV